MSGTPGPSDPLPKSTPDPQRGEAGRRHRGPTAGAAGPEFQELCVHCALNLLARASNVIINPNCNDLQPESDGLQEPSLPLRLTCVNLVNSSVMGGGNSDKGIVDVCLLSSFGGGQQLGDVWVDLGRRERLGLVRLPDSSGVQHWQTWQRQLPPLGLGD